jgi:hypothetical protein
MIMDDAQYTSLLSTIAHEAHLDFTKHSQCGYAILPDSIPRRTLIKLQPKYKFGHNEDI